MSFKRIKIIGVLLVLVYFIYIQALVFNQTKQIKQLEERNKQIITLSERIKSDSISIQNFNIKIDLLEDECDLLQEENNLFGSLLSEQERNYVIDKVYEDY